jgi:tRNA pseudouridine55 synthase
MAQIYCTVAGVTFKGKPLEMIDITSPLARLAPASIFGRMSHLPSVEELKAGGVLLIDKPYRWTSFYAISKIRKMINAKIGHAGTLDPLATGLLICCTGKFTKKISEYQQLPKEYTGIIALGATTATYDLESEPENEKSVSGISLESITNAAKKFTGEIQQVPPIHSAIKTNGKRAYELARKGEEIVMKPRIVTISAFEITKIELPNVHFRVECSTGTYIRSLANDFGAELGCGGYLKELRRTKIGSFTVEDALEPKGWREHWNSDVHLDEQKHIKKF